MYLHFSEKLRVDEGGEVVEDAAHPADGQLERIAVSQRRVDVAAVRPVERLLEEILFQQPGEDGHEIVALAIDIESYGKAEPAAIGNVPFVFVIALGELRIPLVRIRIMDEVADARLEGYFPPGGLQLCGRLATEPVPVGVHGHTPGIGEPFVAAVRIHPAGLHAQQEPPCRIRLQR